MGHVVKRKFALLCLGVFACEKWTRGVVCLTLILKHWRTNNGLFCGKLIN